MTRQDAQQAFNRGDITQEKLDIFNQVFDSHLKYLNRLDTSVLLEHPELKWIADYYSKDDIAIINQKYLTLKTAYRSLLKGEKELIIARNLIKNAAASRYCELLFNLGSLQYESFQCRFSVEEKLDRPEWMIVGHQSEMNSRRITLVQKPFLFLVTVDTNNLPYLYGTISRDDYNKYAIASEYSDHVIIHNDYVNRGIIDNPNIKRLKLIPQKILV
jgi:hypothetical protein